MRLSWKRLAPAETDHELLWLGVSAAGLAASALWFALRLPWPGCAFHALTGLPCITCGATRSTIEFLHGHFHAALLFNPLVFASLCAIALFDVYAFAVLAMRAPRLRLADWKRTEKKVVRILVVALLVLNWAYLLAHLPT
jgi:uncharacterized protein DUF2752